MSKEERDQQIARYLAQKRESYFQGILYNLLQNPAIATVTKVTVSGDLAEHRSFNINEIVDAALAGTDHVMERLYNIKKEGDE